MATLLIPGVGLVPDDSALLVPGAGIVAPTTTLSPTSNFVIQPRSELIRAPELLLPRKQPLGPVSWNYGATGSDVDWAYLFRRNDRYYRLAGRGLKKRLTPLTPAWYDTPYGQGIGTSGSTNPRATADTSSPAFPTSDGSGTGDFSVLIVCAPTAAATIYSPLTNRYNSTPFRTVRLVANYYMTNGATSGTTTSGYFSFITFDDSVNAQTAYASSQVDNLTHCWIGTRNVAASNSAVMELWRDGIRVSSSSQTSVAEVYDLSQAFYIGGYGPDTSSTYLTFPIYFVAAWQRALTPHECTILSADPYLLLKPAIGGDRCAL